MKIKNKRIVIDNNLTISYKTGGEGEALIFIPGWTFSSHVFEKNLPYFAKKYQVFAIDPRSQGNSTKTKYGHNYVVHGKDLKKFIFKLKLKKVILVGWSFGALTAWEYIRQVGLKNVRALIVIDLSFKPLSIDHKNDWVEGSLDEISDALNNFLNSRAGHKGFVEYYFDNIMIQRKATSWEKDPIVLDSLKTPTPVAYQLFAAGMFSNYIREAKLASKQIPTLTVIAKHWSKTALTFTKKHTPKTKTKVLGGHMMFWEHPDAFNQLVDEFLTNCK